MDQPVRDERVKARIGEHDVQPPARRGIALDRRPASRPARIEPVVTINPLKSHLHTVQPGPSPERSLEDDADDTRKPPR